MPQIVEPPARSTASDPGGRRFDTRILRTMDPRLDLEQEITRGLTELRALLANCSTYSVAGCCFSYHMRTAHSSNSVERLLSPAKQIPFLLGVLLSGAEPENPVDFGKAEWERARSILEELFSVYMVLYMPSNKELGSLAPEWHRVREVSMLAFLHYFNNGLLASVHQVTERVKIYLIPFDAELSKAFGISASQALSICQWISKQLQKTLDKLEVSARAEHEQRLKLLEKAENEGWSLDALQDAARDPVYLDKAEKLLSGIKDLGLVSLPELEGAFPEIGGVFWRQFSVQRGEGAEIRYPTEQSIYEERPLIRISSTEAFCPLVNGLFTALLLVGERTLLKSPAREKFLRFRDKALETETLTTIKAFLSPKAKIWSEVYESPDAQYEHDVIVVDDGLCLLIEAKAAPPIEPFRDPDKGFVRIRDAFRSDRGIQKAYQQANRIVRKIKAGNVVPLYDSRGREVGRLSPDRSKVPIGVCVTRDNFGALATNLALLLEKEAAESFPWVVNIIDLSNLAEAWSYFRWGPTELRKYLEERIVLHGKVFSDDELDYAGYFMRHGSFGPAIKARADLLQLSPDYSSLFDELYRHLHLGGPPVVLKQTEPVVTDLMRSLVSGQPVFVDPEGRAILRRKIGRKKPCPCGSGKKYKRCCGASR